VQKGDTVTVTTGSSDRFLQGSIVNTTTSDNVGNALNAYQNYSSGELSGFQKYNDGTSDSEAGSSNSPGSHGYPATAGGNNKVQNLNATETTTNHGNIQEKQRAAVISFIRNQLK